MDVATQLVTPPTETPVSLGEVHDHARITETAEDTRLSAVFIPAAVEYVQAFLKRQLMTATWRLSLPRFPSYPGIIELPHPPLQAITSFTYRDSAGATQTLALTTDYEVDIASEPGRVYPARGDVWPEADSQGYGMAVFIEYTAGYVAATLPAHIKMALLILITHWYDRRNIDAPGIVLAPVRHSLNSLLWKERMEPPNYEDC